MKKIVLIHGLIAGAIVVSMFLITVPFLRSGSLTFNNSMWVGYATMVIALTLVFFGVKSYRDHYLDGSITFGMAFGVGILITLTASLFYCIAWEICYRFIMPDFMEMAARHTQAELKNSGATEAELATATDEFRKNAELYKNPFVRFAMTFLEIFPVGFIITLLSALLLRKKQIRPAP